MIEIFAELIDECNAVVNGEKYSFSLKTLDKAEKALKKAKRHKKKISDKINEEVQEDMICEGDTVWITSNVGYASFLNRELKVQYIDFSYRKALCTYYSEDLGTTRRTFVYLEHLEKK